MFISHPLRLVLLLLVFLLLLLVPSTQRTLSVKLSPVFEQQSVLWLYQVGHIHFDLFLNPIVLTYTCAVGAGVSTAAAIPDFRSASGLFSGKTKGGHSIKDLFHVRCLAVSPIHRHFENLENER